LFTGKNEDMMMWGGRRENGNETILVEISKGEENVGGCMARERLSV
jgi:hypothetical protein